MDTIANRCKIIKKIRNNQIKSDINASTVGEKLLMDIFPAIDGFLSQVVTSLPRNSKWFS